MVRKNNGRKYKYYFKESSNWRQWGYRLDFKRVFKNFIFNAQKYYLIGAEQEDLLQEGILGLLKAIKFYDETKSSFSSFAFLCIRREMISAIRKANTQKNSIWMKL